MEANMANQVNAQANAMSSPQVADTTQFILVDEGKNLYFDNVNGRYVTMTPVTASLNGNNMA
jgi:acetyl/propionyl-CoA carboxylase alpha subunit